MKDARKIGGIAGNESQRALVIERLETVEQLAGDFQVRFHSKTDQHEFIDFFRRANGECCRSDASNRKIGLADRNLCRAGALPGAGLSFPYWQAANRAFLEILISRDCANDLGKSVTGLNEVELARFARSNCSALIERIVSVSCGSHSRPRGDWKTTSNVIASRISTENALK